MKGAKENLKNAGSEVRNDSGTPEWLARITLLIAFFVLILMTALLGLRVLYSFNRMENSVEEMQDTETNLVRVVGKIGETAQKIRFEARQRESNQEAMLRNFSTRQLNLYKQEMDERIAEARLTRLAGMPEWAEFESAFNYYWQTIESASPLRTEERDRLLQSIDGLEVLIDREREKNNLLAHELNRKEHREVYFITLAVVGAGLLVAGLTFYEIRKVLKRLSGAYRESADSRDYLQSLLDSLVSGVVVIDEDGTIKTTNNSFRHLPGQTEVAPDGRHYAEVFSEQRSLTERIKTVHKDESHNDRYLGSFEIGERRLFDLYGSPLMIGGDRRGLILVFVEVTETARAQAELRRNRALAAVGQMTAQIAHEIKNPLGSIRFAAEVLKRRSQNRVPASELQTIQVIERSVDHLASIVAELSDFARPKELNRKELSINELIDELSPMVADRLNAKSVKVEKRFESDLPRGPFDGTELKKLFLNLIINAVDASEPGGVVEISTRFNGGHEIIIDIADRGAGMDEETRRRLFEPFYTTKEKGTGLGMAISKKIVELHKGDLLISSKEGEGTTATVRLPID
ncbi:MAG TPA: ATP-binding protein [Blastocatellia bacterium]